MVHSQSLLLPSQDVRHQTIHSAALTCIMIFQYWGATPAEIDSSVVGDHLCLDASLVATRSITISAPPADVFPWIRQMGFGRAGWYSYGWIDNLGRKSATTIHEEWQSVESGDKVPSGPIAFTATIVDAPRHFVLEIKSLGKKHHDFTSLLLMNCVTTRMAHG